MTNSARILITLSEGDDVRATVDVDTATGAGVVVNGLLFPADLRFVTAVLDVLKHYGDRFPPKRPDNATGPS